MRGPVGDTPHVSKTRPSFYSLEEFGGTIEILDDAGKAVRARRFSAEEKAKLRR